MDGTKRKVRVRVGSALVALAVGAACGGGQPGVEAAPLGEVLRTIVLTGPEGAQVEIAELRGDEALFRITGVRSEVAGWAFRGVVEDQGGGRTVYRTTWDGRDYYPVHRETRSGAPTWRLYAWGLGEPVELAFDEAASAALDVDALYAIHARQVRDGSLARVQSFDRAAAEAGVEEDLAADAARVAEACGAAPTMEVAWDTVPDTLFTTDRISVAGYCETVLDALRNLCRYDVADAWVADRVARVTCAWSDVEDGWALAPPSDGTLAFTIARTSNLEQKAREALRGFDAGDGLTLGAAIDYARTDVCRSPDGEHVVVLYPHTTDTTLGLGYGTPERLFHTPQPPLLPRGWFFEPREFAPGHNENFRGADLRYYSNVEVDRDAGACAVTCGERETAWTLLPTAEATPLLRGAERVPGPFDRVPHALARDRRGTYYYVDRGATEATANDFRVYRGPRGNLRRLEMRDVASDSEGQVLSTASGDLRLILDTDRAQWIRGRRARDLRQIPVRENYGLIYGELGVYLGQRFELPCDDY